MPGPQNRLHSWAWFGEIQVKQKYNDRIYRKTTSSGGARVKKINLSILLGVARYAI